MPTPPPSRPSRPALPSWCYHLTPVEISMMKHLCHSPHPSVSLLPAGPHQLISLLHLSVWCDSVNAGQCSLRVMRDDLSLSLTHSYVYTHSQAHTHTCTHTHTHTHAHTHSHTHTHTLTHMHTQKRSFSSTAFGFCLISFASEDNETYKYRPTCAFGVLELWPFYSMRAPWHHHCSLICLMKAFSSSTVGNNSSSLFATRHTFCSKNG